jgi:YrbI family 3-deoxy-D-manno-octulosonate 8-phosphate phosphatase
VGEDGEELVACNRSDGPGLEAIRRLGIDLLVISTETNPVVGARCRKLGLEHVQGISDKAACLERILVTRRIDVAHVVYVGNDTNDLSCMRLVGCAVAVADAHPQVIAEANMVLTKSGGHGAVRELCDRLCVHISSQQSAVSNQLRAES